MPPPTIQGALKVQGPVFLRKLARASHWGQPADPLDQRVKDAVKNVFRNQVEAEISIYRVTSDAELRRVTVGMNANRDSLNEAIAFAVLLPEELTRHGIQLTRPPATSSASLPIACTPTPSPTINSLRISATR